METADEREATPDSATVRFHSLDIGPHPLSFEVTLPASPGGSSMV